MLPALARGRLSDARTVLGAAFGCCCVERDAGLVQVVDVHLSAGVRVAPGNHYHIAADERYLGGDDRLHESKVRPPALSGDVEGQRGLVLERFAERGPSWICMSRLHGFSFSPGGRVRNSITAESVCQLCGQKHWKKRESVL